MNEKYPEKNTRELFKAILSLKNEKEAVSFFRDLLTLGEIKDFTERFKMARLLAQGLSYAEVAKQTHSSTTTVSRVAHWFFHGRGGYRLVIDRLKSKS
jgi:TrpR-related protein YerC/YecD